MNKTLTIGIAAYNEEANIGALLDSLLEQKTTTPVSEILVVSDGSTDKTDEVVSAHASKGPVRLIRLSERSGQNKAQNRIHEEATGDVLVVLDADMLPSDEDFIEKMVAPVLQDEADLVGVQLMSAAPATFFEKMLAEIHAFKVRLYEKWGNGKNIYMCFGPARSFSKRLYTALRYPDNCPTDAYSYLFAMREGYTFFAVSKPPAIFKVPNTLADHLRQSSRFATGKDKLGLLFGTKVVRRAFAIPPTIFLEELLAETLGHPIYVGSYILVNLYVRLKSRGGVFTSRWEMAKSTKKLGSKGALAEK
ncbi:MAG: hypothetical protein RLZZ26_201 [Candidatus Parcubacteria bacterium]|jgi:glycosyltransferase involved in cell wall biosynthesis